MRKAKIFLNGKLACYLEEVENGSRYNLEYASGYKGNPVSLTLPISKKQFQFSDFPPCFEGLLPEGIQLQGLLKQKKIDRNDLFGQLIAVGKDLVGSITVEQVR
jgi:serine/threonine-protein kinase HipA